MHEAAKIPPATTETQCSQINIKINTRLKHVSVSIIAYYLWLWIIERGRSHKMLYFRKGCGSHSPTQQDIPSWPHCYQSCVPNQATPFLLVSVSSSVEGGESSMSALWLLLFNYSVSDSLAAPWTVAHQASLSVGFPRQEHWSGCCFLLQGSS